MNQKDELYRALVTANQYETDFIFGKGKYIPKRKQGKMRKGKVVLIAALFLLSVTAVTASRGFVFKSSEKTGLVTCTGGNLGHTFP